MPAKRLKQILLEYLKGADFEEINKTISIQLAWEKTAGKPITDKTKILSFKKGTIIINVESPVWRNELSLQKQDLLNKLQKIEPDLNIKKIIFK